MEHYPSMPRQIKSPQKIPIILIIVLSTLFWLTWKQFTQQSFNPESFNSQLQETLKDWADDLSNKVVSSSERPVIYLGNNVIMCFVPLLSRHLFLDSRDMGMTPHLCAGRGWEPDTTAAFTRLIKPDMNIIDVGANMGWFTFLFTQLSPSSRILAVEAQPHTYKLLSWSLEIAGYNAGWNRKDNVPSLISQGNVKTVNVAAYSKDDETLRITFDPERPLNNHLDSTSSTSITSKTITTLAKLYLDSRVDLIKIDVEGAEVEAYKGLRELLSTNPRLILVMEVNTRRLVNSKQDPVEFYQLLYKDFTSVKSIGSGGHFYPISLDQLLASESSGEDVMLVLNQ